MRAGIENWISRHWYADTPPPWYLRMLEPLYRRAFERSHALLPASLKQQKPPVPLVIVGNITAGGSGKTPLVIALSRIAEEMLLRPGIISKGYGRKGRQTVIVEAGSDTQQCGDEPVLLAQRARVPVVVSTERARAVDTLVETGCDVIFSDDGLQQPDLPRSMEICVVDGVRGLGNGYLLPAGPLREPPERLFDVDYVVTNGTWRHKPQALAAVTMQLLASRVCSLDGKLEYTVGEFVRMQSESPVNAVAGIGHPQRFFTMLSKLGLNHVAHRFADHHAYTERDFKHMQGAIVMTEKDAVKCRRLSLDDAWHIPVDTQLPESFETEFRQRLAELTGTPL